MIINKRKSIASKLCFIFVLVFLLYVIFNPSKSTYFAYKAIENCIKSVIPSLICYVTLVKILVSSGISYIVGKPFEKIFYKISGLPGFCAGVYIISFLSGFPSGAIGAVELYKAGLISKSETERLCAVCNNTGPALPCLIIGIGIFNNIKSGVIIYLIQLLSSVCVCLVLKAKSENREILLHNSSIDLFEKITQSVEGAVKSMSIMCTYIILFSVIGGMLQGIPLIHGVLKYFLPYFEIVSGCASLINAGSKTSFIIAASSVSFGGLCVHMQVMSITASLNLNMKLHFCSKFLQGLLAAILAVIYVIIFNKSIF